MQDGLKRVEMLLDQLIEEIHMIPGMEGGDQPMEEMDLSEMMEGGGNPDAASVEIAVSKMKPKKPMMGME